MPDSTIPDALVADLRDYLLSALPSGLTLPAASVRFHHETKPPPSPRLVIMPGDPKGHWRMDTTALVPISLEYITSMDRVTPEAHKLQAAHLDVWLRGIRAAKRHNAISTRTYLHEIAIKQSTSAIRTEEREEATTLRAELTVTLCTVTEI